MAQLKIFSNLVKKFQKTISLSWRLLEEDLSVKFISLDIRKPNFLTQWKFWKKINWSRRTCWSKPKPKEIFLRKLKIHISWVFITLSKQKLNCISSLISWMVVSSSHIWEKNKDSTKLEQRYTLLRLLMLLEIFIQLVSFTEIWSRKMFCWIKMVILESLILVSVNKDLVQMKWLIPSVEHQNI